MVENKSALQLSDLLPKTRALFSVFGATSHSNRFVTGYSGYPV